MTIIRQRRIEQGYSQATLARLVWCTQPMISQIERRMRTPGALLMLRLARVLGMSAASLFADWK